MPDAPCTSATTGARWPHAAGSGRRVEYVCAWELDAMRDWAGVGRNEADQLLERKAGVGSIVLDVLLETKGVGSTEPEELLERKAGVGSVVPDALLEKKGVGSTVEL